MRHALLFSLSIFLVCGCYQSHSGEGGSGCGGTVCDDGEVCCPSCDGRGRCLAARGSCPPIACPGCRSSFECARDQYCAVPVCGAGGECVPRPEGCFTDCPGVCGCDGIDYCNECEANLAGVTLAAEGFCTGEVCGPLVCAPGEICCPLCFGEMSCEPGGCPPIFCPAECVLNEECAPDQFCHFAPEECGPSRIPGACVPRPEGCDDDCPGVCGCDGREYCNECVANTAGVNVTHDDRCRGRPCGRGGDACVADEYCDLGGMCGALDGQSCRERPEHCPDEFDPVCGCDGRTYHNLCFAAQVGVTVGSAGPCAGPVPG